MTNYKINPNFKMRISQKELDEYAIAAMQEFPVVNMFNESFTDGKPLIKYIEKEVQGERVDNQVKLLEGK